MAQNGTKWQKWQKMAENSTQWQKIAQNGTKWHKMAS